MRILALPLALLMLISLSMATAAQVATPGPPPPGLITPDPSECQVEPRPISFFEQLVATPPPPYTPPADPADLRFSPPGDQQLPWTLPDGEPADQATTDAVMAVMREAEACLNANDPLRFLALFSYEMVRTFFAMQPLPPEALPSLAATPESLPSDQWLGYFGVLDARMLPDGRVSLLADTWDTTQAPYGRGSDFAILVKVGDRWLIDALIENVVITGETPMADGTPVA